MDEQFKEEKLRMTSCTWKDTVSVATGKMDTEILLLTCHRGKHYGCVSQGGGRGSFILGRGGGGSVV